jgi:hypothetical protein
MSRNDHRGTPQPNSDQAYWMERTYPLLAILSVPQTNQDLEKFIFTGGWCHAMAYAEHRRFVVGRKGDEDGVWIYSLTSMGQKTLEDWKKSCLTWKAEVLKHLPSEWHANVPEATRGNNDHRNNSERISR